jgi:hypothetical protein
MRLSDAKRKLLRIETSDEGHGEVSVLDLDSITTSDDVAPYPMPLGAKVLPKRKKTKRLSEGSRSDDVEANASKIMLAVSEHVKKSTLSNMGFVVESIDGAVVARAKTGRNYFFRVFERHLVMTLGEAAVFWWDPVGILSDIETYMTWSVAEDLDDQGVANVAKRIADEVIPYIIKLEVLYEIRVFSDLSVERPLSKDMVRKVKERFEFVDPTRFRGGQEMIDRYVAKHGGGLREAKYFFEPLNRWGSRYWSDQDIPMILTMFRGTKVAGHEAVVKPWAISWGDVARLRLFREYPSILEVRYDDGSDEKRWCCAHIVPNLPPRMERQYMSETIDLLPSLSALSPSEDRIDEVELLNGMWEQNADQGGAGMGHAYYKDGEWGIDYANSGMGQGNLDATAPLSAITSFRWSFDESGLVRILLDPGESKNQAHRQPSPSTLDLLFHPSVGAQGVLNSMGRYAYCA